VTKRTGNEGARYERRTTIHFAALGKKVVFVTLVVVVAIVVVVIAAVVIVVIVAAVTVAAVVLAAVVAAVVVVAVAVVTAAAVVVVAATGAEVAVGKAVVVIEFVAVERGAVPKGVQSESVVYRETAERMKTQKGDDGKRQLWWVPVYRARRRDHQIPSPRKILRALHALLGPWGCAVISVNFWR
jgi:hypothetical protein